MTHVLVADDEVRFRNTLARALRSHGHRVTTIEGSEDLATIIAIHGPEVILLDLMLNSDLNGLDICRHLRRWCTLPIIIASVRNDEQTVVESLDAGADDYLVKPFGIDELLARIRAVQRRTMQRSSNPSSLIKIDQLTIDLAKDTLYLNGELLHMTRKELGVMLLLAKASGEVVSYKEFLKVV